MDDLDDPLVLAGLEAVGPALPVEGAVGVEPALVCGVGSAVFLLNF